MSASTEANFDGLVGPTHNHAGLSHGNLASTEHAARVSRPRAAALQGLAKMRALADLGVPQAFLPPQPRPDLGFLRALGFAGDHDAVISSAARAAPRLLAAAYSSSFMWTANAATVTPSADAADGRVHLLPANLFSQPHRALEAAATARTLRGVFADSERFTVHAPLPGGAAFADEGAANHTRFAAPGGAGRGAHFFVFGADASQPDEPRPRRFPARQTREASEAAARLAGLDPTTTVFARQHPEAIDAGVFHNDVIATGHALLHLAHERAFFEPAQTRLALERAVRRATGADLVTVEVPERAVSLAEAVRTYLFNSQLVTLADGALCLVAPMECRENPRVADYLAGLVADAGNPLARVEFFDLRESMANGGGPACLRLRVALTPAERAAVLPGVWLAPARHAELVAWVNRHYRETLAPADLADPELAREARRALDELATLIGRPDFYHAP
jgi:succinylarginine dihydrolase